jgi:putative ABC transport system ATP-binding protein
MEGPPVFRARGLVKRYAMGESIVEALRGVDLEVGAGEVLAVAGPSGSGKSTLLHLLGTLDEPDAGSLEVAGVAVAAMDERARTLFRRTRLGFVFQTFNLLPVLSAEENVELPLWLAGVGARERRARARAALAEVGLGGRVGHRPDQLSGGERQRVAIARALVHRPLAVLADEPTGNLDSETAIAVMDLLTALNRSGGTAFVVCTHDPALIARAPRRVLLRDGRVVADERGAAA